MKNFAYPHDARIRKRVDFARCYEHGKKYFYPRFIIHVLEKPGEKARTGMAVSRKVGNAVARNRVKRVLREFFRLNFGGVTGLDIVVVAKKNAGFAGLSDVQLELAPLLRRLVGTGRQ